MRRSCHALPAVVCLWAVGVLAGPGDAPVVVGRFATAPVLDGRLDDAVWQAAPALVLRGLGDKVVKNATTARVGYDATHLFVGMVCEEAEMGRLQTAWSHAEERDNAIWQDDCVEVFLDPLSRGTAVGRHLIVNSAGVIYDAADGDVSWDCDLAVGVAKAADAWTVEMAIPFRDLGFTPQGGERWLLNLGREQKPQGELSCLATGTGNFANPERYVDAVFAGSGRARVQAIAEGGEDRLHLTIDPAGAAVSYRASLAVDAAGTSVFSAETPIEAAADAPTESRLPYRTRPGDQRLSLRVVEAGSGAVVYDNVIAIHKASVQQKRLVWEVTEPLYEELLSDTPTGLVRDGAMYWFPEIDHGKFWVFAAQYGQAYIKEDKYRLMAEHLLRPLNNSYILSVPVYSAFENYRKFGVKSILMPSYRTKLPNDIPVTFLLDPVVLEAYLEDTRKALTEYGDVIWAVTFGDEVIDHIEAAGITLLSEYADRYPPIVAMDAEVKARYGAGQFGIPQSKTDDNAFRWIAYRRWLTERLNGVLAQLSSTVRATRPGVHVITDDPVALPHALDFAGMRGHADITTHQLYPRRNPHYPFFGFLTKLVADLSGIAEVWPCPHVEEYGASFRPEEVLELLSQVVRNGGTGFHLYLADTVGTRSGKRGLMNEFHGAPDRWQVIANTLAEMRQSRALAFPEPDSAVLYMTDTIASTPGRVPGEQVGCLYTLLGPVAGCWFRFVDEYQLERGEVDLSRFKAVMIPAGTHARRSTVEALRGYVRQGGRVVATDPGVFSFYADGTPAAAAREEFFGVRLGETRRRAALIHDGATLPLTGVSYAVEALPGAVTVSSFDDGTPGLVRHPVGAGECWYFAANPCTLKALEMPAWQQFSRDFHRGLGLATGQPIWRFRFPDRLVPEMPLPPGQCLTNNHIAWRQFKAITTANVDTGGTYSYSVPPDNIRDQGGTADIPFDKGDLTDRRQAPAAGDVASKKSQIQDWIVRRKEPAPFDITFDLKRSRPVDRVRLYVTGAVESLSAAVSVDGTTWQTMPAPPVPNTDRYDVAELAFDWPAVEARYVKLSFGKHPEGGLFAIAEAEIWGP